MTTQANKLKLKHGIPFRDRFDAIVNHCESNNLGYWIEDGTIFCIKDYCKYFSEHVHDYAINTFKRQLAYYGFNVFVIDNVLCLHNPRYTKDKRRLFERKSKGNENTLTSGIKRIKRQIAEREGNYDDGSDSESQDNDIKTFGLKRCLLIKMAENGVGKNLSMLEDSDTPITTSLHKKNRSEINFGNLTELESLDDQMNKIKGKLNDYNEQIDKLHNSIKNLHRHILKEEMDLI